MKKLIDKEPIHFIGIGGVGMSAIAKVFLEQGFMVSGTDLNENKYITQLKDKGANIFYGHHPNNLINCKTVVYSSAISEDNLELVAAKKGPYTVFSRAQALNELMTTFSNRIAVAGTHGKTTTSALIAKMLDGVGEDPTFLVGSEIIDFATNARLGKSSYFVAEADESDGSFLNLSPNIGVILNLEEEHMDYYQSLDHIIDYYSKFNHLVIDNGGYLILNGDDSNIKKTVSGIDSNQLFFFSIDSQSDFYAKNIVFSSNGTSFDLVVRGKETYKVKTHLHGKHNVYNTLAALSLGILEKQSCINIIKSLSCFSGTHRRFQFLGDVSDIMLYDDYAHHPTEIETTLKAVKNDFGRRVICVFQPHRYSRTHLFLTQYQSAFDFADCVFITNIYSANEINSYGVSGQSIVDLLEDRSFEHVEFVPKKENVVCKLKNYVANGDIVVTMGAGDIHTVGHDLFTLIKEGELVS